MAELRNCVLTGASRGLGLHLAGALWRAGFNLFLVARNAGDLDRLLAALPPAEGQRAHAFAADLSDPAAAGCIADACLQTFQSIDLLINNAAIQGPIGPSWQTNDEDWGRSIQVNLMSPIALCRAAIPSMIERRRGGIINLSGGGATGPRPNFAAYAVAKAGLARFTETVAEEVKPFGITVNAIAPGAMKTAMLNEVLTQGAAKAGLREHAIAEEVFAKGGASLENVARLVLFLAGDRSQGITGKLISAVWDDWQAWPQHVDALAASDVYTLRRIAGRDRGFDWGDK